MTGKEIEQIYNEAYKSVYWTAISLLKNEADAEDVVQDTFVAFIESYGNVTDAKEALPLLKKIAANKCLDRIKLTRTDNADEEFFDEIEAVPEDFLPDSIVESEEMRKVVMDIIARSLSEDVRRTLILFYFNEMSTKEIAEALGIPLGTVLSRINFAKKKIKKKVEKYEEDKDSKLFGMALPLLSQLFIKEAGQVPFKAMPAKIAILSASAEASAKGAVSKASAEAIKKGTGIMKTKAIIGSVAAVAVTGAVVAGIVAIAKTNRNTPQESAVVPESAEEGSYQGYPVCAPMYLFRLDGDEILLDVRESYKVLDGGSDFVVHVEYNGETYKAQPVFGKEPIEVIPMDEMKKATGGYDELLQELGFSGRTTGGPKMFVTPANLEERDSYGQPITTVDLEIGREYHIIGKFSNAACPGDKSLQQDMYIVEVGDSFAYAWCADFE